MALIHKKSFSIKDVKTFEAAASPDDYFQCDDIIALPIQLLNKKGYLTEYSCGGHPFEDVTVLPMQKSDSTGRVVEDSHPVDESYLHDIKRRSHIYILFKEGITLPSHPPDFRLHSGRRTILEKYIDADHNFDKNVYSIIRVIVTAAEQLYEWVLSLTD